MLLEGARARREQREVLLARRALVRPHVLEQLRLRAGTRSQCIAALVRRERCRRAHPERAAHAGQRAPGLPVVHRHRQLLHASTFEAAFGVLVSYL